MTNLKIIRKQAKIKQKVVAELLGVTAATVRNWETGYTCPNATHLIKLASLYNTTVDMLIKEA
jgi:DNA-binding transcriptional regulator YiaG